MKQQSSIFLYNNFEKWSSCGNSFLIGSRPKEYGNLPYSFQDNDNAVFIQKLSVENSVDGIIFLSHSTPTQWNWDFFNADGSPADFCGNGAACVAAYIDGVFNSNPEQKRLSLQTKSGVVYLTTLGHGNFEVSAPPTLTTQKTLQVEGQDVVSLKMGVNHWVVLAPFETSLGERLRASESYKKDPANINFVESVDWSKKEIRLQTLELGFHSPTLSCGSGAMATFYVLAPQEHSECILTFPGGSLLVKRWIEGLNQRLVIRSNPKKQLGEHREP
jgi:diaminopimelate epimerase